MPGYSNTPLAKKLGWKPGMRVYLLYAPPEYSALLGDGADGVDFTTREADAIDAAHVFVTGRAEMSAELQRLRSTLPDQGVVWVSWRKRASKAQSEIHDQVIRDEALPMGWVDVKVCAVSEVWSGLKLVVRITERGK